VAAQDHA
jgi:integrase